MEVLKNNPDLEIGSSVESFQKVLDSQQELFHCQIDQFRNIVVTQCKLTGVNPLSQEMAAGAMSVKIGKRPKDLLNPKAVKYMQSVFSIKDAISKKESREISARFGVTVTQVRDFFASRRSRVRKFVCLSKDRSSASMEAQDDIPTTSDSAISINPLPLSSVAPPSAEEEASCSKQEEVLPSIGESDKHFVDSIFKLMRKEETFSGEVKLMEWILQIENPSVLCWFLTKGGLMILATWLSQAASEEQTSVLVVALKVLCHLPLHKALPVQMSVILQAVNRLRFFRTADISNRSRILLSRWSKMFARNQALRNRNGMKSFTDAQKERNLNRRIGEMVGDESWQSAADLPDVLAPHGSVEDIRNMESAQAVKLLTSSDDSNKKHILGLYSNHNKVRRKVLLVEQPGQKTFGKSSNQTSKAAPSSHCRPITADEIEKAKKRAHFMLRKGDKTGLSSNDSKKMKCEDQRKASSLLTNDLLLASEAYLRPKLDTQKKARVLPPNHTKQVESPDDKKPSLERKEPLWEKCKMVQIKWQTPPEIWINPTWSVRAGENSKEVQVQSNRTRREKEILYQTPFDAPSDPKEPWDIEMDYDDSLTPVIPIEQLPDTDAIEEPQGVELSGVSTDTTSLQSGEGGAAPMPDFELLAVLLKNPDLVFALTSGQANGLSSEDTVKLLDMIKSSGGSGMLNGSAGKTEERKVEVSLPSPTPVRNSEVSLPSPTPTQPSRIDVSLPSPTPSSNPALSGWRLEAAKNPFSWRTPTVPGAATVAVPLSSGSQQHQTVEFPATIPSHPLPPLAATVPEAQPGASQLLSPALTHIPPSINQQPTLLKPAQQMVPGRDFSTLSMPPTPPWVPFQPESQSQSLSRQPQQHSNLPEPLRFPPDANSPFMEASPVPEPWRARQGSASNSHSLANQQQNYNASVGGPRERSSHPHPSWQRNETGFESWSPENSPRRDRYREQAHGWSWNYSERRMNSARGHGPPDWSRHHNSSGTRRWRDHDKRR
ncbi:hypothetical protein Nepgr_027837 [Nepenthes gracilis]|uniref:Homeobox domain-containing protein n=1 Tax=Nepenthes gracilis TaxID=150966 RepID=A0AAD3Y3H8_NEPGR|nr:hypothetical protein Nepgr_027837 [Nepenthes gracilis]